MRSFFAWVLVTLAAQPSAQARARGKTVKSFEQKVQDCAANSVGLAIGTRQALSARKNRLADNVDSIDWTKYCRCFVPRGENVEAEFPKGNLPRGEFQSLTENINAEVVSCAISSAATAAGTRSEVAPGVTSPSNDTKFAAVISQCKTSPSGYLTNIRVHMSMQKSPREHGVAKMKPLSGVEVATGPMTNERRNLFPSNEH